MLILIRAQSLKDSFQSVAFTAEADEPLVQIIQDPNASMSFPELSEELKRFKNNHQPNLCGGVLWTVI